MHLRKAFLVGLTMAGAGVASASLITKAPDLGNYWYPLGGGGSGFTSVYADSFVVPGPDTLAVAIGTWLDPQGTQGTNLHMVILGDAGGAPDPNNILGTTASFNPTAGGLNLYMMNLQTPVALTIGKRYWFAATTVGDRDAGGYYQTGGHTQNSGGINDNGTFWYSNDPTGQFFDGQNLTPEMAFQVELQPVPEPASLAALSLGALAMLRRRRATK